MKISLTKKLVLVLSVAATVVVISLMLRHFVESHPVTAYQKTATGLTASLGGSTLRLDALAPGVIRVRYSANGAFPPDRIPVLLERTVASPFTVSEQPDTITLASGSLHAVIDRATGAVRFVDDSGKPVVSEAPGGRTLVATTFPGKKPVDAYTAQGKFEIAPDESLYGLGQHQHGKLDQRETVVNLQQLNREISIPFLISSRGYGILWNNASRAEIALGSDANVIPSTSLSDDSGQVGGLTAHYFSGTNFEKDVGTTLDPQVDFAWKEGPMGGLTHDNYSVRWTGFVTADEAGSYTFQTASDDGVRLWIDGKPVIDDWSFHAVTNNAGTVHFDAATRHAIRLEYYQANRGASIKLSWQKPGAVSTVAWNSEAADIIDYVVFYGPSVDTVIAKYRDATGQAPLIPKWALGYWQSKERYSTQQELLDVAREYRSRKEPIDNIVQDWYYWNPYPWGSHKFDPKRYPNPTAAFKSLHDENLHVMISVWGMFHSGSSGNPNANYDAMNAKGYLYPPAVKRDLQIYDAFNPHARDLYWDLMRDQLYSKGVDAWWLDSSEPEVNLSEFRHTDTSAGLGAFVLNAWPLMHATGVSDGQMRDAPNKRVFILTRSAFAGQQRTGAATWSGDISATWDVYAHQIPAGLNICLSGIPYWTTDIGGFFVAQPRGSNNPAYRELYTRWFQYGAFCPLFRSHGSNTPREMWRFGPDTEKILMKYDSLRYRMMPYIYSQAWQVTRNGGTIMRALVMDFPKDAFARVVKDEFMFGPSLLVCPVTHAGAISRSVYLPEGAGWTNFWTGAKFQGGQSITASAPIDKIPLYIKDGAILPLGPSLQYVAEKAADPIDLKVCAGANSDLLLYEDEGSNNDYRKGQYSTIPISWSDSARTLTIGNRMGSFQGMLKSRTFRIAWVKPGAGVTTSAAVAKTVTYDGSAITVQE
ncbi:MAG TPA: TIM-barrel domain-containing protein [Capsulimonadaceae bacterium]|jgi:alpha-D-xyloside xylohydrolase